jgi:hypothetical protein
VGRLYLVADRSEVVRRRGLLGPGQVAEVWADHAEADLFWMGEASRALLDAAGPRPLAVRLSMPEAAVPVYYGPRLVDIESLPREESLRARVLSARGIAVAWITLDRFGERTGHVPQSPADPVFHLRRIGGGAVHVWRLFRTRDEAVTDLAERHGRDSEASDWAQALDVRDFAALLRRHADGRAP